PAAAIDRLPPHAGRRRSIFGRLAGVFRVLGIDPSVAAEGHRPLERSPVPWVRRDHRRCGGTDYWITATARGCDPLWCAWCDRVLGVVWPKCRPLYRALLGYPAGFL